MARFRRRADDDVHGIAGSAADDSEHVQDRGRIDAAVFHVAARALAAQALSIFGDHSDVMAVRSDRICHVGLGVGAGGARYGADRAGCDASSRGCRSCISSTASGPLTSSIRSSCSRTTIAGDGSEDLVVRIALGAQAGASLHPRYGAEPRRVLPGPRDGEPFLRPRARAGAEPRWTISASLPDGGTGWSTTVAMTKPTRGRPDGLGRRDGTRDGRFLRAVAKRSGSLQVRLYRPFPAEGWRWLYLDPSGGSPSSTGQRSRVRWASRSFWTC